jgi:hypothetical protein
MLENALQYEDSDLLPSREHVEGSPECEVAHDVEGVEIKPQ